MMEIKTGMKTKTDLTKIIIRFVIPNFFTLWICCSVLCAQDDAFSIRRGENGTIKFARFLQNENLDRRTNNDIAFLKSVLNASEGTEFRLINEKTDKIGITTKRFQQYHSGVKVDNAQYLLHIRNVELVCFDIYDNNFKINLYI